MHSDLWETFDVEVFDGGPVLHVLAILQDADMLKIR